LSEKSLDMWNILPPVMYHPRHIFTEVVLTPGLFNHYKGLIMDFVNSPDIVAIIIASCPGWFALIIAAFGVYERRMEKRDTLKLADALATKKAQEDEKARIYKEVAMQVALEHETKSNGLAERITALEVSVSEIMDIVNPRVPVKRVYKRKPV